MQRSRAAKTSVLFGRQRFSTLRAMPLQTVLVLGAGSAGLMTAVTLKRKAATA